jgi:hypothetical protein
MAAVSWVAADKTAAEAMEPATDRPLIERNVVRAVVLDSADRVLLLQVGELGNPKFGGAAKSYVLARGTKKKSPNSCPAPLMDLNSGVCTNLLLRAAISTRLRMRLNNSGLERMP